MDESDAIDQVADYAGKRIVWLRGEKILLDADLARLYGVTTARLNEQVKRNAGRFPPDFAFRLTSQEFRSLMSQFATSSSSHGGNRRAPMAFTEHGALMAAAVLNSEHAIRISIYVVRAFIQLRQTLATHKALASKLEELERRTEQLSEKHDRLAAKNQEEFRRVIQALRELMAPPARNARPIGFVTPKVATTD
jgi:hypothetical protein